MIDQVQDIKDRYKECMENGSECLCVSPNIVLNDIKNLLNLIMLYEDDLREYSFDGCIEDNRKVVFGRKNERF